MASHHHEKPTLTPREWLTLHPLVPAAILLVAGLAMGRATTFGPSTWILALLTVLLAYVSCEIAKFRHSVRAAQVLAAAGIVCFGAGLYVLCDRQVAADDIALCLGDEPSLVEVRARVTSTPREIASGDTGIPLPAQQFCIVEVDSVRAAGGWSPASGRATLRAPAEVMLHLGDHVELCGFGRRPTGAAFPGGFDYRAYLASSQIYATLWARQAIQIQVLPADVNARSWRAADLLEQFRQSARAKIQSHIAPADAQAGEALQALVLGYRTPAMQPVTQAFADAGVAHLLAISGSHIVLVAGIVWFVLHPLARRPRVRVLLMVAIVWLYVAATPAGPPILRAAIALSFFALATLSSRPIQPLNILAGALIVCLLIEPTAITDAGLQLSFAATVGLLVLAPRMHAVFIMPWAEYHAAIARAIGTRRAAWWFKLRYGVLLALLANFIGSMISAPLVAYHFCQLNPLATFTGVFALPIVSISLVVGLVHLLASALGIAVMATPAVWCAAVMNKTVFLLAEIPGSAVVIRPPTLWMVGLLFAVLMVVILRRQLRLSRAWALLILLATLIGVCAWYPLTQTDSMRIWTLGRSAVMQYDGRTVVMNPGSATFARSQLDPFLRRQGIGHVDAMMVTSHKPSQSAGGRLIASRFQTPIALISQQAYLARNLNWTRNLLVQQLQDAGCNVVPAAAGDVVSLGGMSLRVLWPPPRESLVFHNAQSPLMVCVDAYHGSLYLIPDAFPDSWPMSPESHHLRPETASAIVLTSGTDSPVPGIPALGGDEKFGAYELRDGRLIEKTK